MDNTTVVITEVVVMEECIVAVNLVVEAIIKMICIIIIKTGDSMIIVDPYRTILHPVSTEIELSTKIIEVVGTTNSITGSKTMGEI